MITIGRVLFSSFSGNLVILFGFNEGVLYGVMAELLMPDVLELELFVVVLSNIDEGVRDGIMARLFMLNVLERLELFLDDGT